jgi:hypothetical protein
MSLKLHVAYFWLRAFYPKALLFWTISLYSFFPYLNEFLWQISGKTVLLLDFVSQFGRSLLERKVLDVIFYKKVTGKPGLSRSRFVMGQAAVKNQVGPWSLYRPAKGHRLT